MVTNFPPKSQPTDFSSEPQIHTSNLLRHIHLEFSPVSQSQHIQVSQTQLAPHFSHLNEKTHYSLTVQAVTGAGHCAYLLGSICSFTQQGT